MLTNGKAPEKIGPYRIAQALGQGGMGVVYDAVHEKSGEKVALKTVTGDRRFHLGGLQREIRALARIRHPGIVRIIDHGMHRDLPWYAMERLSGVTLDDYAGGITQRSRYKTDSSETCAADRMEILPSSTRWWTKILGTTMDSDWHGMDDKESPGSNDARALVPVSEKPNAAGDRLEDVLILLRRICLTLAYLHGEGIVHRDLKPSNILIHTNGMPVIMDFGLMLEFWGEDSRDDLESYESSGGTLLYISPEQITGDFVDARADLYSLGCIMYEIITGQLPFTPRSTAQAVQAHLNLDPVHPSELVTGCPSELEDLIMRLLTKSPGDRIGHADHVAVVLSRYIDPDPVLDSFPMPRPFLYRSGFSGRRPLFHEICSLLDDLKRSKGGLILLGGESGIGKTRFLMELRRTINKMPVALMSGEGNMPVNTGGDTPGSGGMPFRALSRTFQYLCDYCRNEPEAFTDSLLGSRGRCWRSSSLECLNCRVRMHIRNLRKFLRRLREFVY